MRAPLLRTLIAGLALVFASLTAAEPVKHRYGRKDLDYYADVINEALRKTNCLNGLCVGCSPAQPEPSGDQSICQSTYENLFKSDTVNVRFVLGYADGPAFVHDRYQRQVLVDYLTSDCEGNQNACGFSRDPDNDEIFTKTIYGPDLKEKKVVIRLVSSSSSVNDRENRIYDSKNRPIGFTEDQEFRSKYAEQAFFDSLSDGSDISLVVSHARKGGGVSFKPGALKPGVESSAGGQFDYSAFEYSEKNPDSSANRMINALANSPRPPKLLGVFACDSKPLWGEKLKRASPNTGMILENDLADFNVAVMHAYQALDSVLAMRCENEFNQSLNAVTNFANGKKVPPIKAENFFRYKLF